MNRLSIDIVDFHSHILPGADHGSANLETTDFQLNEAVSNGITRIIATPHFYPTAHSVENFIEKRDQAYNKLLSRSENKNPEIRLGAEVLICENIEYIPGLERLYIEGTKTLLLELPYADFSMQYCDSVYALISSGVDVIIAHADRYAPKHIECMIDSGARLQLNANSLATVFKRRNLYDWMERGLVVAIGSDIHGKDKTAYPSFNKAIGKIAPYIDFIKSESDKIFNSKNNI